MLALLVGLTFVLLLVLAGVALARASRALEEIEELRRQLASSGERAKSTLAGTPTAPVPPPGASPGAPVTPLSATAVSSDRPPLATSGTEAGAAPEDRAASPEPVAPPPAPPRHLPVEGSVAEAPLVPPTRSPVPPREEGAEGAAAAAPSLEAEMGSRWLLYLGAGALVVAAAFFVKLAFDNRWITESLRVALGALGGSALVVAGHRFVRAGYPAYGQGLAGGGVAMLYLSIYAAFNFYALLGRTPAFGLMVVVTALAAGLADRYRAESLAVLAVGGGFLTPFLVGGDTSAQVALFGYDAVLVLGTAVLAHRRDWPAMNLLSYLFVLVTVAGWLARHYTDQAYLRTVLFLTFFCACFVDLLLRTSRSARRLARLARRLLATAPILYYFTTLALLFSHAAALLITLLVWTVAGLAGARQFGSPRGRLAVWVAVAVPLLVWAETEAGTRWLVAGSAAATAFWLLHLVAFLDALGEPGGRPPGADLVRLHANGLGLYAVLHLLAGPGAAWPVAAAGAIALGHAGLAAAIRRRWPEAARHAAVVAASLGAMAATRWAGGAWVEIGLSVESAGLTLLGLAGGREAMRLGGAGLLAIAVLRQIALQFQPVPDTYIVLVNARTVAAAALMAALYGVAWRHRRDEGPLAARVRPEGDYFLLAMHAVLLVTVTAEIHAFWELRGGGRPAGLARQASLLVAWALQAAGILHAGLARRRAMLWRVGAGLMAVPVAWLTAVLWTDVLGRVVPPQGYVVLVNARGAAAAVLTAILGWLAAIHRRGRRDLPGGGVRPIAACVLSAVILGLGYLSAEASAFWYSRHAGGGDPRQVFHFARELTLSVLWAASAVGLVAAGIRRCYPPLRYFAIALFFATVAKVALVDLAELGGLYRVASLSALGILLLTAAFLYQRYRVGPTCAG